MRLLRFLWRTTGIGGARALLWVATLGVLAAAVNGALIALVHRALQRGVAGVGEDGQVGVAFLGLAAARIALNHTAGRAVVQQAQDAMYALRTRVTRAALSVDYARFEQIGPERIMTALTEDAAAVSGALQLVPTALVSGAMSAGGAAYLLYLSPQLFGLLLLAGLTAVALGVPLRRRGRERFGQAREAYDGLYAQLQTAVVGAKELKLDAPQRRAFLADGLEPAAARVRSLRVQADRPFLTLNAINSGVHLLAIGVVLFLFGPEADTSLLSGYVLTTLFIMGPTATMIRALGAITASQVALRRIAAIDASLGEALPDDGATEAATAEPPDSFEEIALRGASFRYADRGFTLGPLDLTLRPGQLVLVSGENGSGKSTLVRLLCGLYTPSSGQISRDGEVVDEGGLEAYRALFSVLFYDFHLFDSLDGLSPQEGEVPRWLSALGLAERVKLDGSTLRHGGLSSGQARRLALMHTVLRQRPVCVLDEVGADQDPRFRAYLHDELLPRLRAEGRCVVVVSHDVARWPGADLHLRLVDGRPEGDAGAAG